MTPARPAPKREAKNRLRGARIFTNLDFRRPPRPADQASPLSGGTLLLTLTYGLRGCFMVSRSTPAAETKKPHKRAATLADVARIAGVVPMTASRAINNSGYVRQ